MGKVINFNDLCERNYKRDNTRKTSTAITKPKPKLYIPIGIPCSGKSTYVKRNFNNSETIIVSSDEIRKELTGTYNCNIEDNKLVFELCRRRISEVLQLGFNVIYDATNTYKKFRKDLIRIGKEFNAEVIAIVFKTPLEICLDRNSKRSIDKKVPTNIILKMSLFDPNISKGEGFDSIEYIKYQG